MGRKKIATKENLNDKKEIDLNQNEINQFFDDDKLKDTEVIETQNNEENNSELKNDVFSKSIIKDKSKEIEVSEEYANEKLEEAKQTMSPKKRKKSIIISLIFLLINIVFMTVIVKELLSNIEDNNIFSVISSRGKNLWWLAGTFVAYIFYILVQSLMYYELIKSLTGKKQPKVAYDVALVGKYYDNVTPFAVGGQPMQIYRLSSHGMSPGCATSIPIIKMIILSFVNMILALLFFCFGLPRIPMVNELNGLLLIIFEVLGIIGLIITIIVTTFLFLLSSGNFITRSVICGFVRIGYKLKLVKNYRQTVRKLINQVAEYRSSMKFLINNKLLFFKLIVLSICECLSYASMAYFVVRAFASGSDVATFSFFMICLVKYYICAMASSYIPLPGGTGLMEITFIFLFGIVVNDYIVWALLLWRIFSYYLLLVHGFTHEMIIIAKNLIKTKKENVIKKEEVKN